MKTKEKKQPIDWLLLGQLLVVILVLLTYLALEVSSTRRHTGWFGRKELPTSVGFSCDMQDPRVSRNSLWSFRTEDPAAAQEFVELMDRCVLARQTWYTQPLRAIHLPEMKTLPYQGVNVLFDITYPGREPYMGNFHAYFRKHVTIDGRDIDVYFAPYQKSAQVEAAFWEELRQFAVAAENDPRWQVEKWGGS